MERDIRCGNRRDENRALREVLFGLSLCCGVEMLSEVSYVSVLRVEML